MPMPEITLEQIRSAEQKLAIHLQDEDRLGILLCRDTIDVWACPGSGKTSLLVAKLHLLASEWTKRHRGICALSHTNVAKEEIIKKMMGTAALRLLEPPHFVDTIQRFVHEYLAIPALIHRFGIRPTQIISNEHCGSEIGREINFPQYIGIRNWLRYQPNPDAILAEIRFSGPELQIVVPSLRDPNGVTYRQLREIKFKLAERGVFTFRDMYSLGEWYIANFPIIKDILAHRFPVVFLDETQDTNGEQWRLLETIFGGRSKIQRFGDHNQAIFQSPASDAEGGSSFPMPGHLSMRKSYRLSRSIAHLVEGLSLTPVELIGNEMRDDRQHTILLFEREAAGTVLPAFAKLVIQQFPQRPTTFRAAAVASIGKPSTDEHYPTCIQHYWPDYDTRNRHAVPRPSCFAEYIRLSQAEVAVSGSVRKGLYTLLAGVIEVLRLEDVHLPGVARLTVDALIDTLRINNSEIWTRLSAVSVDILSAQPEQGNTDINRQLHLIAPVLLDILNKRPSASRSFVNSIPADFGRFSIREPDHQRNVYHYAEGDNWLDVHVGTIHSVKGQTHDATLVLESRYYTYDLERLKSYLWGERPRNLGKRDSDHLRRIYVGVTRPRELLVLAMQRDHVSEVERNRFVAHGWTLIDVE